jgi:hypothetical protein
MHGQQTIKFPKNVSAYIIIVFLSPKALDSSYTFGEIRVHALP